MGRGNLRHPTFVLAIAGILFTLLLAVAPGARAESGWEAAALLEREDSGDANAPQIAFDSAGNGIAVWHQYDGVSGFRNNIWANRYVPRTGWGAATLIETNDTGDAQEPKIAMAPDGNAIAVWQQYDGIWNSIWANRYVPGTGWGIAMLIEANDTGSADAPQIALDLDGNGIAVWSQYDEVSFRYNLWANRFAVGVGWGTATLIESDETGDAQEPEISIDANGNGTAVWRQSDGVSGRYNIWANQFAPGTGWGTASLVETDDAGDAYAPHIAVDPTGNRIAVWEFYDGVISNLWANRFVPGTGWGAATLIETDDTGDAYAPRIALDANGNGIAVWESYDGVRINIWANRFVPGSGWGSASIVDTGGGDAFLPQVALDPDGNGIAVWEQYDGFLNSIAASRYMPGRGWGTAMWIVADRTGDATAPQVALDPNGHGIAVWSQSDGSARNIWANRFNRDVAPPLVVLTSPTEAVTRDADVTVAGVTEPEAWVTVDGASVPLGSDGSFSTTVTLVEGPNTIAVVATDDEGNEATVLRSITRDSVPPTLTVSTPSPGAWSASSLVRVAGTVEVGAALSVHGLQILPDAAGAWRVDIPLPDGTHTIIVRAVDLAGNNATLSRQVTVDTVVPEITLTSPMTDLTRASLATVSGVVSDPSVSVAVNGAPVTVGAAGEFSTTVSLVEGPNEIEVAATDAAGNLATVTKYVTRDSTPPALAMSTPANGAALATNIVRVSGTSEAGADLVVNGLRVVVDPTGAWSVDLGLTPGENTIMVVATDAAGNTATRSVSVTYEDPVSGIDQEQGRAREDLLQIGNRLDALGLQTLGILAVLLASLALNGLLFLRYRTLQKALQNPPGPFESPTGTPSRDEPGEATRKF